MGSKSKQPAARLGDIDAGHPPYPPTPVITGSPNVSINGRPAARQGDMLAPHHPGVRTIAEGSSTVLINGKPAARTTDGISCGGKLIIGSGNVFIGDRPRLARNAPLADEFEEIVSELLRPGNVRHTDHQKAQTAARIALKHRGTDGAVASWHEYYVRNRPAPGQLTDPLEAEGFKRALTEKADDAGSDAELDAVMAERTAIIAERTGAAKAVQAETLADCVTRLQQRHVQLADAKAAAGSNDYADFYRPKYTDEELMAQAAVGEVANERFHVRIMSQARLNKSGDATMLGQAMETESGKGAKYWSTTFDQLEDKDSDPELICHGVGIDYKPGDEYCLAIIDTWAARDAAGTVSVVPTFHALSAFANRELPDEFPPAVTEKVMTAEFQQAYFEHYQAALSGEFLRWEGDDDTQSFDHYLQQAGLSEKDREAFLSRFAMQSRLGNNQHFEGSGLTKRLISGASNKFGVVETFNFERKMMNIADYKRANAITILSDLELL